MSVTDVIEGYVVITDQMYSSPLEMVRGEIRVGRSLESRTRPRLFDCIQGCTAESLSFLIAASGLRIEALSKNDS